ncbi:MAG: sulfatase-like hydrolase/transferase [Rikenellaceae bacterium]|nr:sulfatase-like hydrolase/transferase [Rikenellaceae bacterium]
MKATADFRYFLYRILWLYVIFMLCRATFYVFNAALLGPISWGEVPELLHGGLVFDSVSIFYLNLPFLFFSLIPFRFRAYKGYQIFLLWLFVVINASGLGVNLADVCYFPYKLARISSDDFHLMGEGNRVLLVKQFLRDYWYGFVMWGAAIFLLWSGFKKIGYRATEIKNNIVYGVSQTLLLAVSAAMAVFLIRGANLSPATFPINIGDASMYAAPRKTPLVLSNPFCVIRNIGQQVPHPEFFSQAEADSIFTPVHPAPTPSHLQLEGRPNVVLIVMESIAAAHIKALSDQFSADAPSYTPFLDSLIAESYVFRNAYNNGIRSIDALPALWASIPTFKTQFLALPQSTAPTHALPASLKELGYSTAFMHGAVRESMSFVAFGKSVGIEHFWSREEYEEENGHGDFDGLWGIWDHKFLPYAGTKLGTLSQPFFATLFTLSSHHPYKLPADFEGRYPEGAMEIHRMIGYSDDALRRLFAQLSRHDWYESTIFILTADHGSGADNEKYRQVPYDHAVPLIIYSPAGWLRGDDTRPAQHIDLMPTLLGLLGYDKPYFAFGKDLFESPAPGYSINYAGGVFNTISDDYLYRFDEHRLVGVFDYLEDPLGKHNLLERFGGEVPAVRWTEAFIQQYYSHIRNRSFTVE